jgi:hypothetical protein
MQRAWANTSPVSARRIPRIYAGIDGNGFRLLRTIQENIWADGPRLAFAEWLLAKQPLTPLQMEWAFEIKRACKLRRYYVYCRCKRHTTKCRRVETYAMPETDEELDRINRLSRAFGRHLPRTKRQMWSCWLFRGFVYNLQIPLRGFMAHAARLFLVQPILDVRLSDRWPVQNHGSHLFFPQPAGGSLAAAPFALPDVLFRFYQREVDRTKARLRGTRSAMRAVSAACVNYGRSLVGLPEAEYHDEPDDYDG